VKTAIRICILIALAACARASTITAVAVYEPLSLHGTDADEAISESGEALQATVLARPMALTGAFPEALVQAIRSPHLLPSNSPLYKVQEVNLLVLCNIGIHAEMTRDGLMVRLDISNMAIPSAVDLTSRQVLKLTLVAIRKTLEEYQKPQTAALSVHVVIEGAEDGKAPLRDAGGSFVIKENMAER
jgi:hypothetical protein